MKLKAVNINISTGGPLVVYLHRLTAMELGLTPKSRIGIKNGRHKIIALVDIIHTETIMPDEIGILKEASKKLRSVPDDILTLFHIPKPITIAYIKKKLNGKKLSENEICAIIKDIKNNLLSEIEISYFVAASYIHGLDRNETISLTKSMIKSGNIVKFHSHNVIDKHCIGGVAGNRTTMIVVPILSAAGYIVPKTSSRSITSPAGTADTMEVFAPVDLSINQMKRVVKSAGGCIVWGGALDLAPVDDLIINVEHPLSLDPKGQLLASVLSKKRSVSSNNVLIDIPYGNGSKIDSKKEANGLRKDFEQVGKAVGLNVCGILTDGRNPIGKGLGPVLEAIDVYKVLSEQPEDLSDLIEKSIQMAGKMLELGGKYKRDGEKIARDILYSKKALQKFNEIAKKQGAAEVMDVKKLCSKLDKESFIFKSKKSGKITQIDNKIISKIAKIAGAPHSKGSGVYLIEKQGTRVKVGDPLFKVYTNSKKKITFIKDFLKLADPFVI